MSSHQQFMPHFQEELTQLKSRLLVMGGQVEEMVSDAVRALVERDNNLAEKIIRDDEIINKLHLEIDERCFKLLALHQPMASDLRMIVSSVRINSDLERVGDFAVNIAEAALRYLRSPSVKPLIDIPKMADIARGMLRDSLNAFVSQDAKLAQETLDKDDQLDELNGRVFSDLLDHIVVQPDSTKLALELILISRHLERIGDHATNIAEGVIFIVSGLDVRHHAQDGSVS